MLKERKREKEGAAMRNCCVLSIGLNPTIVPLGAAGHGICMWTSVCAPYRWVPDEQVDLTTEAIMWVTYECEACTIIKRVKSFWNRGW